MSADNSCSFIGNIGQDPVLKVLPDGKTAICNFSVAATTGWGEKKGTLWINCAVFGKQAEIADKYLKKGKQVAVIGSLNVRPYKNAAGEDKFSVDLSVDSFKMLGRKEDEGGEGGERQPAQSHAAPAAGGYDDDIPF